MTKKTKTNNVRNNLDLAILLTDAILNTFEKDGKCNIPLDQSKDSKPYSWDLQDAIQTELEKIAEGDNINDNTKSIAEGESFNYMKRYYLNKRVKIKGEEFYGRVVEEYASEVVVSVENIAKDNELYFKKSEVEIVNDWMENRSNN